MVGLATLADSIAPGKWRGMITGLERIVADEPERKEAPDSNQDWAQTFLNRSVIHLVESFLKKETSLEQARLEDRRAKREAAFLALLNERYAAMIPLARAGDGCILHGVLKEVGGACETESGYPIRSW